MVVEWSMVCRYISGGMDKPRFTLHYRTDAPMDIRALLYVPEVNKKPQKFIPILGLFTIILFEYGVL